MITPGARWAFMLFFCALVLSGCKHVMHLPGGDIRLFEETEPVAPMITPESRSGGACGPDLAPCPGGTQCFTIGEKSTCLTEKGACEAAGCGDRLCQIVETFPLGAVCY
jgi:hypothetical protein